MVLTMVYRLKGNQKNIIDKDFGTEPASSSEKRQKGVYLFERQWSKLDILAEETGCARNEVLRKILSAYFSQEQVDTDE